MSYPGFDFNGDIITLLLMPYSASPDEFRNMTGAVARHHESEASVQLRGKVRGWPKHAVGVLDQRRGNVHGAGPNARSAACRSKSLRARGPRPASFRE